MLNVGSAHLGEFGSREAIAAAKSEVARAARDVAVLNASVRSRRQPLQRWVHARRGNQAARTEDPVCTPSTESAALSSSARLLITEHVSVEAVRTQAHLKDREQWLASAQ